MQEENVLFHYRFYFLGASAPFSWYCTHWYRPGFRSYFLKQNRSEIFRKSTCFESACLLIRFCIRNMPPASNFWWNMTDIARNFNLINLKRAFWAKMRNISRNWKTLFLAKMGENRPKMPFFGAFWTNLGPNYTNFKRIYTNFHYFGPKSAQKRCKKWSNFERFRGKPLRTSILVTLNFIFSHQIFA